MSTVVHEFSNYLIGANDIELCVINGALGLESEYLIYVKSFLVLNPEIIVDDSKGSSFHAYYEACHKHGIAVENYQTWKMEEQINFSTLIESTIQESIEKLGLIFDSENDISGELVWATGVVDGVKNDLITIHYKKVQQNFKVSLILDYAITALMLDILQNESEIEDRFYLPAEIAKEQWEQLILSVGEYLIISLFDAGLDCFIADNRYENVLKQDKILEEENLLFAHLSFLENKIKEVLLIFNSSSN